MNKNKTSKNIVPALTLMLLAPLITEVLPGATRFSSLFVFPVEVCVWGGGAVLIRHIARKMKLGWISIFLMALALSVAEEFLIQQSSLAPLVIQLKGTVYARFMGINYIYLLWALIYESVFVVMLPIHLTELIFPERKAELWIGKKGLALIISMFIPGSFLAWFTWTQIARPNVFHLPAYHPPVFTILTGIIVIAALVFKAIRLAGNSSSENVPSFSPPPLWVLFIAGAVWATLLFGLVLIAFDISPAFPPEIAVAGGILLAASALFLVPRWYADTRWNRLHEHSLIFGTMAGSMLVSFAGFIGSLSMDLYFKIIVDLIAFILLIRLGRRLSRSARLSDSVQERE